MEENQEMEYPQMPPNPHTSSSSGGAEGQKSDQASYGAAKAMLMMRRSCVDATNPALYICQKQKWLSQKKKYEPWRSV